MVLLEVLNGCTNLAETIAWGGSRMITAGGTTGNSGSAAGNADSIDYVNATAASGNAADFGDLSAVRISLMCSIGYRKNGISWG